MYKGLEKGWRVSDDRLADIFRNAGWQEARGNRLGGMSTVGFILAVGEAGLHGWSPERIKEETNLGKQAYLARIGERNYRKN